jgi:hypothetical protein
MLKKAITFSSLLLLSSAVFSQTVDQLKKENQKLKSEAESNKLVINDLKAKVDFCNAIEKNKDVSVKSFTDFYSVKVLKCKGNRGEQAVTVELLISHDRTNQHFSISGKVYAYDALGNTYELKESILGVTNVTWGNYGTIPTSTPVKLLLKFSNILPGLSELTKIDIPVFTQNLDGAGNRVTGNIEIRNLKIDW